MSSSHLPAEDHAGEMARSIRIGERSTRLIALSDAALEHLRTLEIPALLEAGAEPDPVEATDTELSQQTALPCADGQQRPRLSRRRARAAAEQPLQRDEHQSRAPDLRHGADGGSRRPNVDLATDEPAQWELVSELVADEQTRSLPVVFTANDAEMLDAAETRSWPAGGRFHLLKPFDPALLGDVIHALIGPA